VVGHRHASGSRSAVGSTEIVIEHDYASAERFRAERAAFHDQPEAVGEVLARIVDLAVPGSAEQFERDGVLDATGI
jgi:hypothetical protein